MLRLLRLLCERSHRHQYADSDKTGQPHLEPPKLIVDLTYATPKFLGIDTERTPPGLMRRVYCLHSSRHRSHLTPAFIPSSLQNRRWLRRHPSAEARPAPRDNSAAAAQ